MYKERGVHSSLGPRCKNIFCNTFGLTMRMFSIFFLIWGICCGIECKQNDFFEDAGPIVKTGAGSILGKYIKFYDTDVAAFFGIPYAKPPLGERRFTKAEPAEPWDGILIAQKESSSCIQSIPPFLDFLLYGIYSEDCLYLNVFAPRRRYSSGHDKLPVLVWIHGGGLAMGSADTDIYDGSKLVTHGEVIVVSMNYRLGPLGFVNVGNEDAPGNVGLMDQVLAMKWVKHNIEVFGGDPDRITLFGESAGSWSVSLHLISPMSRNLFHHAILQSGSMYSTCFVDSAEDARKRANSLAVAVDCANDDVNLNTDPTSVIQCLKQKDPLIISAMDHKLRNNTFSYVSAGNEFMPNKPIDAYDSGDIAPVDIMLGSTRDEGSIFLPLFIPEFVSFFAVPKLGLDDIEKAIPLVFKQLPSDIHKQLSNYYFQNITEDDKAAIFNTLQLALADYLFNCPNMFLAEKLNNAFVYWMTHEGSTKSLFPAWLGVHHAVDLVYLFGKSIPRGKALLPRDEKFSNNIVRKWTNFARNGHPMSEANKQQWTKFSIPEHTTYELNEGNYRTIRFPREEQCKFWRPIIASDSGLCTP